MFRKMLKSKIQFARITFKNLRYTGSITIDGNLIEKAKLFPNEMVMVANINNGARFETYVIRGKRNSGIIGLNGAAARLGEIGDELIIMSYEYVEEKAVSQHKPKIVLLGENNRPRK